jgi:PAS domain S-box-containing protein
MPIPTAELLAEVPALDDQAAAALHELHAQLVAERADRERLQNELDLRNSALDSAKSHVMVVDVCRERWVIVYTNRALAVDHGYEPSELIGRSPAMLVPAADNAEAFERIAAAVRDGTTTSNLEVLARRQDGSRFWAGLVLAPVHSETGHIFYYVGVGANITAKLAQQREQRELQEKLYEEMRERERMAIELRLAQKLESVGRLAAGIAHEINTPIQYIGDSVSFLQTAQTDLDRLLKAYRDTIGSTSSGEIASRIEKEIDLEFLSREMPKAFARTLEGVERVAAIVRAMKEFAHPDAIEHSSADLNHALETTLTVAHNEYKYSAQIETRLGELPLVPCNVGEMNQVFLNLIVNAAHAIAEAGKTTDTGRITIATATVGSYVEISIEDNGSGIPQEHLEKIFDPFFTTKPVGKGTGQGLAIARSIITEKHGGRIDVHSVVGQGTRFVLRLPIGGRSTVKAAP